MIATVAGRLPRQRKHLLADHRFTLDDLDISGLIRFLGFMIYLCCHVGAV